MTQTVEFMVIDTDDRDSAPWAAATEQWLSPERAAKQVALLANANGVEFVGIRVAGQMYTLNEVMTWAPRGAAHQHEFISSAPGVRTCPCGAVVYGPGSVPEAVTCEQCGSEDVRVTEFPHMGDVTETHCHACGHTDVG